MSFATLDELRQSLAGPMPSRSADYTARMVHPVPETTVVDRVKFILGKATGKVVLDVGASGPLHEAIVNVAKKTYSIDRPPEGMASSAIPEDTPDAKEVRYGIDLDAYQVDLPVIENIELVICGEVIEHLSNPGWFLDRVHLTYPYAPVIITVPNAFSDICRKHLDAEDIENVNLDHVAWYSWRTLKTLVERHGYQIIEFYWQNGRPNFAEGLIFVVEGSGHESAIRQGPHQQPSHLGNG